MTAVVETPLNVAAEEVGQDPHRLIESLEKEEVARAGHDPQRRIWDPLDEQPAALARDDSVIVTGEDERWCSDQLRRLAVSCASTASIWAR
jgi:hypothetical protein